ncbi:hypothetical protein FH972_022316 [Carpinus fangiana]|uniref:Uncharacterized protein n=1 Tax=Carpinus fangiana TaxID=176857 RepID=A0A5N6KSJ4_9ROSI|nr:hypothetical protein FH972_022316 [Carpinus fangiana]
MAGLLLRDSGSVMQVASGAIPCPFCRLDFGTESSSDCSSGPWHSAGRRLPRLRRLRWMLVEWRWDQVVWHECAEPPLLVGPGAAARRSSSVPVRRGACHFKLVGGGGSP